jgi:hypothetical protein
MTTRAQERADTATMIVQGVIAEFRTRHGLRRKMLSKQQRHEIGKAKISYVIGNLNEEDLRRAVDQALTGPSAICSTPNTALAPTAASDDTR